MYICIYTYIYHLSSESFKKFNQKQNSSKLPIYGRKHTSQDSRRGLEKVYPRGTRCTGSVNLLTTRMWSIHSTGLMPTGRDKVSFLSLSHRDVVLLLSCWRRWDHGSISESAINTWLKNVNLTYGPDCEDSPHLAEAMA